MTEVREKTAKRTSGNKTLIACSQAFKGSWQGSMMDVSAPPAFREVLGALDRPTNDG